MGKFNAGGFKPLTDLSSRHVDLKTVSEKVHRVGRGILINPPFWLFP